MNYDQLDLTILKALISDKKNAIEFVQEHTDKLFLPETWNFARTIISYVSTYKELPTLRTLTEKLKDKNVNDKLIENISNLWNVVETTSYDPKEFSHDLDKIKKRYAEKQITGIKEVLEKVSPGNINIDQTISSMQKSIQDIKSLNSNNTYENLNVKDYLPQFVEKFNAKKDNPELDRGIMTGYSFLDYATNGAKPADFILVAGESGFGKSLLLNNIAIQVWMQKNTIKSKEFTVGKNICMISLEMPLEDCFNRFVARLSGVPVRHIENAKLTKEEFSKLKEALDFINKYPYNFRIIDMQEASSNDIETIINNTGEKYDAIFVDYLGIMETNEKNDEADWMKQSEISRELRAVARKFAIPIFSAVQLNRKKQTGDSSENIGLNRLARSSGIATHATHVIQIESRSNEERYGDLLLHLIKCRKGPKTKGILIKNLACATLLDKVDDNNEEYNNDNYFTDIEDISDEMERL